MTNKEKFKEIFDEELAESIDFDSACTRISQIVALRSMYIKGVDNICEWFNAEYKEQTNTAEWIKSDVDEIYCSKCGCKLQDEQMYIPKNFCPNCGADMRKEKTE